MENGANSNIQQKHVLFILVYRMCRFRIPPSIAVDITICINYQRPDIGFSSSLLLCISMAENYPSPFFLSDLGNVASDKVGA
jgi:hypothetical protein